MEPPLPAIRHGSCSSSLFPLARSRDHEMELLRSGKRVRRRIHRFPRCLEYLLQCVILRSDKSRYEFGLILHGLWLFGSLRYFIQIDLVSILRRKKCFLEDHIWCCLLSR